MMVRDFFMDLYCVENLCASFPISSGFPTIPQIDLEAIHRQFLHRRLKRLFFSMGALKTPSPDGLHTLFYQS